MRTVLLSCAVLFLWGCADNPVSTSVASKSVAFAHVPMGVIVTLKSGKASEVAKSHGIKTRFTYSHALNGFAANLSEGAIRGLSHNPHVMSIEPDGVVKLAQVQSPAPWNQDRLDSRSLVYNNSYSYDRTGEGVNAYLIDNGVFANHPDFGGRVLSQLDFAGGGLAGCGHATHVAGILGGAFWGAAKEVSLHSLNVFPNCTGSTDESVVIAAIDWVTANAIRPAVVNMSTEGPLHVAMNTAVQNSIASGLFYAVAAGNGGTDACTVSPASVTSAFTVGATVANDRKWSTSNFGNCVDLFAPGNGVTSAWNDGGSMQLSGTSMAAPHVAGVAAMYLEGKPLASPQEVSDSLKAYSSRSVVAASQSANCNLLYSGRSVQSGRIPKCPR